MSVTFVTTSARLSLYSSARMAERSRANLLVQRFRATLSDQFIDEGHAFGDKLAIVCLRPLDDGVKRVQHDFAFDNGSADAVGRRHAEFGQDLRGNDSALVLGDIENDLDRAGRSRMFHDAQSFPARPAPANPPTFTENPS